jgi:glutamate synthase domain-containing protein 1
MQYEGETRIPSGCAISGIFSRSGRRFSGEPIIRSITPMHDRSNGLGGGFAAYGIYPKQKDLYAFHVFYDSVRAKEECEHIIQSSFDISVAERIPTRKVTGITDAPAIWRYFALPFPKKLEETGLDERDLSRALS